MSNCSNCGSRPYLCQRCRLEELENRIGTPADHDIDRWVLENDCWHASTEFDGQTHDCACETEIETPLERSAEDLRYVPEEYDAPVCEDCVAELERSRQETVPADATFERASKLVTDGGIDVDAVRAEVPFWIQFQGRRASAIHIPAEDCTRDDPDSACQYERSATPWTFEPDSIPDKDLRDRLCKTCAKQVLGIEEDNAKYGRTPADVLAENGFDEDDEDDETSVPVTDGGWDQPSAVSSRRKTPRPLRRPRQHLVRDQPLALRRSLLRPHRGLPHQSSTSWCYCPCPGVGALKDITSLPIGFGRIRPNSLPGVNGTQYREDDHEIATDGDTFAGTAGRLARKPDLLLEEIFSIRLVRDIPQAAFQTHLDDQWNRSGTSPLYAGSRPVRHSRIASRHKRGRNPCELTSQSKEGTRQGILALQPQGTEANKSVEVENRPEIWTDGGEPKQIDRHETIAESPTGDLQIGSQNTIDEIDDVCTVLEALQKTVGNPEVKDALRSATSHAWRASILQRVDENTDVRMTTASGPTDTVVHGPDPVDYKRERGER